MVNISKAVSLRMVFSEGPSCRDVVEWVLGLAGLSNIRIGRLLARCDVVEHGVRSKSAMLETVV